MRLDCHFVLHIWVYTIIMLVCIYSIVWDSIRLLIGVRSGEQGEEGGEGCRLDVRGSRQRAYCSSE